MTSGDLEELLAELESALAAIGELDDATRQQVFTVLDGIDALHRVALTALGEAIGGAAQDRARASHPAVAWLLDAYGVGVDERAAAEQALEPIRPYIHGHGGAVEVLGVAAGVVHLRLSGACSGCTASARTLEQGILEALQDGFPGFARIEVEPDDAPAHPPPDDPVLHQIGALSARPPAH